MRRQCPILVFAAFLAAGARLPAGDAALPSLRLDLGPVGSPVEHGYEGLGPAEKYSRERGYGWEGAGREAFDVARPPSDPTWLGPSGQLVPEDYVIRKEHTALTRDGVTSAGRLRLRADLPDGTYQVRLVLGRLDRPACSMQVSLDGRTVAEDVHARHYARRGLPDYLYGFPRTVRRTVDVRGGALRIEVFGDDSGFRRRFDREFERPPPVSYLVGVPTRNRKPDRPRPEAWGRLDPRTGRPGGGVWVYRDIGCPFTEVAISAVEVLPHRAAPLEWADGRLRANTGDASLRAGAEHFNARRYPQAEREFRSAGGPLARALGLLWLAGAGDLEEERRLLPEAIELLKGIQKEGEGQADPIVPEALEQSRRLAAAVHRFDRGRDRQRVYTELLMIPGEVDSFEPGDPLYPKGEIYAGRALHMIDPHRWAFASHAGRQILEDLASQGVRGRYIDWYLREQWSDDHADWSFTRYDEWKKGAPPWAAEIFEAYNRELELAEWWIRNRQADDGSLGGGWGDDVEILRSFAAIAGASPDASPLVMRGIRRLADGAWHSGSVDTEAGYFAEVGDSEHSGEWTADTLTAMIRADYGNPVYLERAMKTAKLMRDLWMDVNPKGWLLMRSNFLGATGIGGPPTASDTRINYRPAAPALFLLRYNRLPEIERLFVRWADAWLAASLSTERGKPRGVIPQEIAFADGRIGGAGSPAWFRAAHPPGTVNYDWGGVGSYHDAIVDLLVTAYRATSDSKYLEPMDLESEFVEAHLPVEARDSPYFRRAGRPHPSLWVGLNEGGDAWVAAKLASWPGTWHRMRQGLVPREDSGGVALRTLGEAVEMAAEENEHARRMWPHVTTEMIATDRVYFPGLGNAVRVLTGRGLFGYEPLVTYSGLGRDVAGAVLAADAKSLGIALYSFAQSSKRVEVIPWHLDVGPTYSLELGPDADSDGRLDSVSFAGTLPLTHRGQGFAFDLPPRLGVVVRIRWKSGASTRSLAPDLAITARDLAFVPEYRRIDVTVHNVGALPARSFEVVLYRDGQEAGRQSVPHIPAPTGLVPATVRVGFEVEPTADRARFKAVIDERGAVAELAERNNVAEVVLELPLVAKKRHAHP